MCGAVCRFGSTVAEAMRTAIDFGGKMARQTDVGLIGVFLNSVVFFDVFMVAVKYLVLSLNLDTLGK